MFCVAATTLVPGSTAAAFSVVLSVAVSTLLLLSYLVIFPTMVRLRRRCPTPPRRTASRAPFAGMLRWCHGRPGPGE